MGAKYKAFQIYDINIEINVFDAWCSKLIYLSHAQKQFDSQIINCTPNCGNSWNTNWEMSCKFNEQVQTEIIENEN